MARGKQLPIKGTEDPECEELEDAASSYEEARDRRMACTKDEVETKEKVISIMRAQKKTKYHRGDLDIEIIPDKVKLKVRRAGTEDKEAT